MSMTPGGNRRPGFFRLMGRTGHLRTTARVAVDRRSGLRGWSG
jgi:hypothetical protein